VRLTTLLHALASVLPDQSGPSAWRSGRAIDGASSRLQRFHKANALSQRRERNSFISYERNKKRERTQRESYLIHQSGWEREPSASSAAACQRRQPCEGNTWMRWRLTVVNLYLPYLVQKEWSLNSSDSKKVQYTQCLNTAISNLVFEVETSRKKTNLACSPPPRPSHWLREPKSSSCEWVNIIER